MTDEASLDEKMANAREAMAMLSPDLDKWRRDKFAPIIAALEAGDAPQAVEHWVAIRPEMRYQFEPVDTSPQVRAHGLAAQSTLENLRVFVLHGDRRPLVDLSRRGLRPLIQQLTRDREHEARERRERAAAAQRVASWKRVMTFCLGGGAMLLGCAFVFEAGQRLIGLLFLLGSGVFLRIDLWGRAATWTPSGQDSSEARR